MEEPRVSSARPRRLRTRLIALFAVGAFLVGAVATSGATAAPNGPTIPIQLLSFNDFHGNLEPPTGSGGRLVIDHALNAAGTAAVDVTTDTLTPPGVGGV